MSGHNNSSDIVGDYLEFLKQQPAGFVYHEEQATTVESPAKLTTKEKQKFLDQLKVTYFNCQACPLATQGRSQVVFGHGNPDATLMFVGEGPGRDEDEQGYPFVGRAGQLLTKIIEAMGLTRDQVYISNVVKCRPPENRAPLPIESSTCKNLILFREIDIVQPKIMCALGATALQALLGEEARLGKFRGIFTNFKGILLLPTYHPAYLLRNPAEKRTVWEDMKKIMEKLKEMGAFPA